MNSTFQVAIVLAVLLLSIVLYPMEGIQSARAAEEEALHGIEQTRTRLLVGDGESGLIRVIETEDGKILDEFEMASPASLYAGTSGRYGYAVQSSADKVSIIDGGIYLEPHDDHVDLISKEPSLLSFTVEGMIRPIHFVEHEGQIAIFFDGSGTAAIFNESDLNMASPPVTIINSTGPHHGAAVPMKDRVLMSIANSTGHLQGVGLYDLSGNLLDSVLECAGLHGEASIGGLVAFGCRDGVLLVEIADDDSLDWSKISNVEAAPAGARVGTVISNENLPFFIGNFAIDSLVRISPDDQTMQEIKLPGLRHTFKFTHDGEVLLALTSDGMLHSINPDTGEITNALQVTMPFSVEGGSSVLRPALIAESQFAYIADPNTGEVVKVEIDDSTGNLSISNTIAVGGKPSRIALVGVVADTHADEGPVAPPPQPQEFSMSINAVDLSGNSISGVWTVVRSSFDNSILAAGFSPLTFTGVEDTYTVSMANYAGRVLEHWEDGSTSTVRTVVLSSDVSLTATYDHGSSLRGFTSLVYAGQAGYHDLTVNAVSIDGSKLLRMWTVIQPVSVDESGTTYKVYIHNYQDRIFEHWEDGSTERIRTLTITEDTTITAYYQTG